MHKILIKTIYYAGVNIRAGESRATPLHFAARIRPKRRTLKGIAQQMKGGGLFSRLVQQAQQQKRQASIERETSVILLLHKSGANVNDVDIEGQTPLHCATIKGNISCVHQLLECEGIHVDVSVFSSSFDICDNCIDIPKEGNGLEFQIIII